MKKRIAISVVVIALIAAVVFTRKGNKSETVYVSAPVVRGDIVNSISATGTVTPVEQVEIGTQVSGTIEKVHVDFNDQVKAGQVIAELDKQILTLQVNQSNANYRAAQSELTYRKSFYDRVKNLNAKQMATDEELEQALFNYERAKANLESAKVERTRARTNLGYATIKSPIDGVVLYRAVDEGQTVASSFNTPTLFTIARDLTEMEVEANIDEADIGQIHEGLAVAFTVDTWPDTTFTGTVKSVRLNSAVESNVVTYPVIISTSNDHGKLFPGMTATVEITTSGVTDVLTVPAKALRFKPELPSGKKRIEAEKPKKKGPVVWIKTAEGMEPRPVKTGERNGSTVEIRSGLSEGDSVVVSSFTNGGKESKGTTNPLMPRRRGGSSNRSGGGRR